MRGDADLLGRGGISQPGTHSPSLYSVSLASVGCGGWFRCGSTSSNPDAGTRRLDCTVDHGDDPSLGKAIWKKVVAKLEFAQILSILRQHRTGISLTAPSIG